MNIEELRNYLRVDSMDDTDTYENDPPMVGLIMSEREGGFVKRLFPKELKVGYRVKFIKDTKFKVIIVEDIENSFVTIRYRDELVKMVFEDDYNVVFREKKEYFPENIKVGDYLKFDIDWSRTARKIKSNPYPNQHIGALRSLAINADGSKLISSAYDKMIKIWDGNTGECLKTMEGHKDTVHVVEVLDNKIISGSSDKTVKIWDIVTGKCLNTLKEHKLSIRCFAFYNDKIISGSFDDTVKIWDMTTGNCLDTLVGHSNYINSLAFDEKRNNIISGTNGGEIKIWDFDTGKCLKTINDKEWTSMSLKIKNDNLIACSQKGLIKIWDLDNYKCINTYIGDKSQTIGQIEVNGDDIIFLRPGRHICAWNPLENTVKDIYESRCEIDTILVHDNKIYVAEDLIKLLNTEGKHLKTI
ncbi:MAG: WD40 repeat domain-containing protein [Clostridiales bacterium]